MESEIQSLFVALQKTLLSELFRLNLALLDPQALHLLDLEHCRYGGFGYS
jgi:hypothetical protein